MEILTVNSMALIKADRRDIESLRQKLTLKSVSIQGQNKVIKLYKDHEDESCLWIPRQIVAKYNQPIEDAGWQRYEFNSKITLRPKQIPLVNKYLEAIETTDRYGGIIEAATGTGKTIIGIEILCRLGLSTLITVPLDHLMNQWIEELQTFTNLKKSDIGIIRGGNCIVDKPVVLSMLHSLAKRRYPDRVYKLFGLHIIDEVHTIAAQTFSEVAKQFHSKYRLGLSATVRRKDGMQDVFFRHIGRIIASDKVADLRPKVLVLSYNGLDSHHSGCIWNGNLNIGRYLNKIYTLPERNKLIVSAIISSYNKNRKSLVLSDRIEHLKILKKMLIANKISQNEVGIFTANVKTRGKITLATYGSFGMGVDDPELDTLIYATPRVDIEQSVGRILRISENKKEPLVIDILDKQSSLMVGWFHNRNKYYKKYRADIIWFGG